MGAEVISLNVFTRIAKTPPPGFVREALPGSAEVELVEAPVAGISPLNAALCLPHYLAGYVIFGLASCAMFGIQTWENAQDAAWNWALAA